MNRSICAVALSAAALLAGPAVHAAGYPTKPVTMIVPFVPGGSSDITARSVTPGLTRAPTAPSARRRWPAPRPTATP